MTERRTRTFAQRAVEALDRVGNRPFTRGNLQDWLSLDSQQTAQRVIAQLAQAGCIRFVGGAGPMPRMFERIPGVAPPADLRGRSPAAQKALEKGRVLRMKASRGFVLRWKP